MNYFMDNSPISDSKIIKDLIKKDVSSEVKSRMLDGFNYYHYKHDICNRTQTYYVDGVAHEDYSKSNNKIVNNYFKLLVDQKIGYLVGKPIVLDSEVFKNMDIVTNLLGEKWDDVICEMVKNTSSLGTSWLHPFITDEGEFDYQLIDARQIIPIYDTKTQTKLETIIRYYTIQVVDLNGKESTRYKVEWWDKEKVTYFVEDMSGNYSLDASEPINPCYHWYTFNTLNPVETKGNSWGKVPFVQIKNNEESESDLECVRSLIDSYNLNTSDFANDLSDIQELILALIGYDGEDLGEYLKNLKVHKAVKIGEGGDVKPIRSEIPFEARDKFLSTIKENIFLFGGGVDFTADKLGNSPSGIALKFLFSTLDLKCDVLERKVRIGLRDFLWFVCEYMILKGKPINYKDIKMTFNKSMLINEGELIDNLVKSEGIISKRTATAHHPFVEDLDQELEQIEDDKINTLPPQV